MLGWSRWINYINPIAYAFESLMINEFASRDFFCAPSMFIPSGGPYNSVPLQNKICAVLGARAGETSISGIRYLEQSFSYSENHLWRNLGIMLGYSVFFMCVYLILSEFVAEAKSKGEVLLFRNESPRYPATQLKTMNNSSTTIAPLRHEKTGEYSSRMAFKANIQAHTSVLHWQNVCYDLTKGDCRRILDHVDGWIKPGTCTALMVPPLPALLLWGPTLLTLSNVGCFRSRKNYTSRCSSRTCEYRYCVRPNIDGRCCKRHSLSTANWLCPATGSTSSY